MKRSFKTKIGRLRLLGYLEGISLLVLIFVAVPMKYILHDGALSTLLGPVHGALFLMFMLNTISVGIEYEWEFTTTIWKILLACFIPFGTFYIDHKFLRHIKEQ